MQPSSIVQSLVRPPRLLLMRAGRLHLVQRCHSSTGARSGAIDRTGVGLRTGRRGWLLAARWQALGAVTPCVSAARCAAGSGLLPGGGTLTPRRYASFGAWSHRKNPSPSPPAAVPDWFHTDEAVRDFLMRQLPLDDLRRDQGLLEQMFEHFRREKNFDARSNMWLGIFFRDGFYVLRNDVRALSHFQKAIELAEGNTATVPVQNHQTGAAAPSPIATQKDLGLLARLYNLTGDVYWKIAREENTKSNLDQLLSLNKERKKRGLDPLSELPSVEQNWKKGLLCMQMAAEYGNNDSLVAMGAEFLNRADKVENAEEKAERFFRQAWERSKETHGDAGYQLASLYYAKGEVLESLALLKRNAEKNGCLHSKYFLGHFHHRQNEVEQALTYLESAAKAGYEPAITYLGRMYLHGDGVPKDLILARSYFQRGSENGGPYQTGESLVEFGRFLYAEGSWQASLSMFQRAAVDYDAGEAFYMWARQVELGQLRESADPAHPVSAEAERKKQAFELYQHASDRGCRLAWPRLAEMWLHGKSHGAPFKDAEMAKHFQVLSASAVE